jgi:hypothetical protein
VADEPKPPLPDKIEVQVVAPGGEVVETLIIEIGNPALTPARVYDHQCWSEAAAFEEFVAAIRQPDGQGLIAAMRAFDRLQCWNAIWARLAQLDVDNDFRASFRSRTCEFGYRFRQSTGDLKVVIPAFRHLLPPYSGPSLHLYRGELTSKHLMRDYGFSWTTSIEVALDGDSTLSTAVPIKSACRCVSVPAPAWG